MSLTVYSADHKPLNLPVDEAHIDIMGRCHYPETEDFDWIPIKYNITSKDTGTHHWELFVLRDDIAKLLS